MQEFIVGEPGAYRRGRFYRKGQAIVLPDTELPSVTFTWPNGAPVEISVKRDGEKVAKALKPMGKAPPAEKVRTEEDEIASLEEELARRKEALKARAQPALSQVKNPPKDPGTEDGNAGKSKGGRPSDQPPA